MFLPPERRPAIMGVLNVTPDSFSDGGRYFEPDVAVERALAMIDEGADIVDVGGESTRPGAQAICADEELGRTLPVVRILCGRGIAVSIDTSKAEVASACIEAGAQFVNDVTALSDPAMARVCSSSAVPVCLMHMQGTPRTMQTEPRYGEVVEEVRAFLVSRAACAEQAGIAKSRIWIDPGIGFGKDLNHNLALIGRLDRLVETGYSVLIGVSRKSFVGKLVGGSSPDDRLEGSLAAQVVAQLNGVRMIRTHDVRSTKRAIEMVAALRPELL